MKKAAAQGTLKRPLYRQIIDAGLLLPFFLALAPLRRSQTPQDLLIFGLGFATVLTLILISNTHPIVVINRRSLTLHLLYSTRPEEHPFEYILGFRTRGHFKITLFSYEHMPITLSLKNRDRSRLVSILQKEGIYAIAQK